MKTEAEKIAEFKPKGCYCCTSATFDMKTLVCICSLKGVVEPLSACISFKLKGE